MDRITLLFGEGRIDTDFFKKLYKHWTPRQVMHWFPRVLGVGLILFLAVFALDVFEEGSSLGQIVVALFMHLIPNFILAILLAIAWKKPIAGGGLFMVISAGFWIFFDNPFLTNLVLFGPIFLTGLLFLFDGFTMTSHSKNDMEKL